MSKLNIMSQIYGYTICLVSLMVIIFTFPGLIESIMDNQNPILAADLESRYSSSAKYLSFEDYKTEYIDDHTFSSDTTKKDVIPPDSVLLNKYNEEKKALIDQSKYNNMKKMITQIISLVICIIIFLLALEVGAEIRLETGCFMRGKSRNPVIR